jgi:hypothetical protein
VRFPSIHRDTGRASRSEKGDRIRDDGEQHEEGQEQGHEFLSIHTVL